MRRLQAGFVFLVLSMLACEPVIAVGWRELLCVFGLMAFLFGPPAYRFLRRLADFRKYKDK